MSKNPAQLQRTSSLYFGSLFWPTRPRESTQLQQFCPSEKSIKELNQSQLEFLPATKNYQDLGDSEDESDAKIFFVPDSETRQESESKKILISIQRELINDWEEPKLMMLHQC